MTSRAIFTFDHDHTIFSLASSHEQTADPATDRPSIAVPAATDYGWRGLYNALRTGAYIWIDPSSDLPEVAFMDGNNLNDPGNIINFTFDECAKHLQVVGYNPRWVDAMELPLMFPPLARYILGAANAVDLYDLGGEAPDGTMTPADDGFDYCVYINYSIRKPLFHTKHAPTWRFSPKVDIVQDTTGGGGAQADRTFVLPTFAHNPQAMSIAGRGTLQGAPVTASINVQGYHTRSASGANAHSIGPVTNTARAHMAIPATGDSFRVYFIVQGVAGGGGPAGIDSTTFFDLCEGGYYV